MFLSYGSLGLSTTGLAAAFLFRAAKELAQAKLGLLRLGWCCLSSFFCWDQLVVLRASSSHPQLLDLDMFPLDPL